MTKHIVLGSGNLGKSLYRALPSGEATLFGPDWRWPRDQLELLLALKPQYVWCAVGGGSVDWVIKNPLQAKDAIVRLPLALANALPPGVGLICFSSDYCASERWPSRPDQSVAIPRSGYANLKRTMEDVVIGARPDDARVVRVGSLYGRSYPHKTLAGRLRARYPNPCELALPANLITPTSTDWIAQHCILNLEELFGDPFPVHHLAPRGCMTVVRYGEFILGPKYAIKEGRLDPDRPPVSNLGSSFGGDGPRVEDALATYPPV